MNLEIYQEYISRVNSVQDYISTHIDQDLSLGELAGVAGFSEYHFHRIFTSMVKETLYKYINRLRMEKAANLLVFNHKKNITEITFDCGFSNSAVFARSFKKHYNTSASKYRILYSKNRQTNSKNCIEGKTSKRYHTNGLHQEDFVASGNIQCRVDIQNIKEITVVYMRYTGPYKNNPKAYKRLISNLIKWAEARELLNHKELKLFSIYHDNPEITEKNRQRTSICLAVPENTPIEGEVGKMTIPSGKYAIGQFEISSNEFEDAWNYMFGDWLPSSGYQADDNPCFELYKNNPDNHPQKKSLVDIYLPVRPL